MAPHSSNLAWQIPWMEEPGRLQSVGSLRVRQDWATSLSLFTFTHWRRKWQPTPVFLPGESQWQDILVGCRLWGRTELYTTEVTPQQQPLLAFLLLVFYVAKLGFPCSSVAKEPACSTGDLGSIPGLWRSPGEGNSNPLQYPCLENLTDTGAWWAAVHGVTKNRARLSD